jgi:3-deoxy-D-manno-octulosonic-acid transferase
MPHASLKNKINGVERHFHGVKALGFPLHVRLIFTIYRGLLGAATPILGLLFKKWAKKDPRWLEFMGLCDTPRPQGRLVWIHGASLGELRSGLTLIHRIRAYAPDASFVVTGCDATCFSTISKKLPLGSMMLLWPLDTPLFVQRFLDHWRPDAACILECEIWPNLWLELHKKNIPFFNINFTVGSDFANYKLLGGFLPCLLSLSSGIWMTCKKPIYAWGLKKGLIQETLMPGLKYGFSSWKKGENTGPIAKDRRFWFVSCTVAAEESLVLDTHKRLRQIYPDLLLVWALRIAPTDNLKKMLQKTGLTHHFRSQYKEISEKCDLYIIDTLGELDLFYSQSPFVVMGNSFTKKGYGHSILEPIAQGCLPITGPYVPDSQDVVNDFLPFHATVQIPAEKLFHILCDFLEHPEKARSMAKNGEKLLMEKRQALSDFLDALMVRILP